MNRTRNPFSEVKDLLPLKITPTLNPPACKAVKARAAFFLLPESSDPELLSLLPSLSELPLLLLLLLQSSSRTMVSGSPPGEFLAFVPELEEAAVDALLLKQE